MDYLVASSDHRESVIDLVFRSFSTGDSVEEGEAVSELVNQFFQGWHSFNDDLLVLIAQEGFSLCGVVLFSRLSFAAGQPETFILSPMAVDPKFQGQGIGQALIRSGIRRLQDQGIQVLVTYGDPNFYTKVGFVHVTTDQVPAPYSLSFPHGWLARGLNMNLADHLPLTGPSRCLPPLANPSSW